MATAPATETRNAQTWVARKPAVLARKLRTPPKTNPIIPGSAHIAFHARRLGASDKCFILSLNHSTSWFLSFGVPPTPLVPPVRDTTIIWHITSYWQGSLHSSFFRNVLFARNFPVCLFVRETQVLPLKRRSSIAPLLDFSTLKRLVFTRSTFLGSTSRYL